MPQQQRPDSISNGMMKKMLLASLFFLFLGLVPHALAQQSFVPLAPIPGLTDIQPTTDGALASFFNNLYKYLIGLAATLAVIEIIWGGLEISTQDSISKQSEGKKRIQEAITGLVLVLSPALVFSIINPSILDLSLNLPKLDLYVPPTEPKQPNKTNMPDPNSLQQGLSGSVTDSNGMQTLAPSIAKSGVYKTESDIPKGMWCYGRQNTSFVCDKKQESCAQLFGFDPDAVASCKQY